jgi:hypothetical protein
VFEWICKLKGTGRDERESVHFEFGRVVSTRTKTDEKGQVKDINQRSSVGVASAELEVLLVVLVCGQGRDESDKKTRKQIFWKRKQNNVFVFRSQSDFCGKRQSDRKCRAKTKAK